MKQLLFLIAAALVISTGKAQTVTNPYPRTITVSGSAEMEVIPDEIYVQVDLREYEKKGSPKVSLDQIKTAFLQSVRSAGIPDSAVTIASYEGYIANPWRRKKDPQLFASISYQLKLNNSNKVDQLVNLLDDDATQNFSIVRTSHSKMIEYRKQLKIMAVKAAKDKAVYLTEAINEKVGEAITISEPMDISLYYKRANAAENSKYVNTYNTSVAGPQQEGVDFKKIKLIFEVNAVFALK
jgi:uncharacterized protein